MTRPNDDSEDYWSGPAGQVWISNEEAQDAILSAVIPCILDRADVREGDAVLDIGCGTGALTLAVAEQVGPSGRVIASDISKPLLERAGERASDLPQVSTFLGDAQMADWPFEPVDVAVSRFGVMFFNDPSTAFANIARALKPGGRMVFAAWGPYKENPWWVLPQRAAVSRLGQPPRVEPNAPGPMAFADRDYARQQVEAAGLVEVSVTPVTVDLICNLDAVGLAELSTKVGPAYRVINLFEGTEEDVAAIRAQLAEDFAPFVRDGKAYVPACLNLITARKG